MDDNVRKFLKDVSAEQAIKLADAIPEEVLREPGIGPALVILGMAVAQAQGDKDKFAAFVAIREIGTKLGIMPSMESMREHVRQQGPEALARFLKAIVPDAQIAYGPVEEAKPSRRNPWKTE